jgi:transposase
MRISWRTVGHIITRVSAEKLAAADPLGALRRIGIDEISYKRGHKYLVVVVDHDSGRLVWAAPGRDMATLHTFFDVLGEQRAAALTHVSADGADWIATVVAARAPAAVLCADPFYGGLRVMPASTLPVLLSAWPAHPEAGIIRA